jgi:hypothetical protein
MAGVAGLANVLEATDYVEANSARRTEAEKGPPLCHYINLTDTPL